MPEHLTLNHLAETRAVKQSRHEVRRSEQLSGKKTIEGLALGDRVRMSALGLERHPKYGKREGVIVGKSSPSSFRVKFDERETVQTNHHTYLVNVEGA